MSKLKLNNSISSFLKNNKVKLVAISLSLCMATTLAACNSNMSSQTDTSYDAVQAEENRLIFLKKNIEKNIDNMIVTKNIENSEYIITEQSYVEIPIYDTDEHGKMYVDHIDKQELGTTTYSVTFEQAQKLEVFELLESKVKVDEKIK